MKPEGWPEQAELVGLSLMILEENLGSTVPLAVYKTGVL